MPALPQTTESWVQPNKSAKCQYRKSPACGRCGVMSFGARNPTIGSSCRPSGYCKLKERTSWCVPGRPQSSAMGFNDRAADRQAHTQTAGLCRVEGVKHTLKGCWRQARTRISYRDMNAVRLRLPGADKQLSRSFVGVAHGLNGIQDQVENHLLKLHSIAFDERQALREIHLHRNPVRHCFATGEFNHPADRGVDVQALFPGRRLLRKGADSVNDVTRSHAVMNEFCEHPLHLFQMGRSTLQKTQSRLSVDDRGSDRLFHFMDDRGQELAHRGHAIGVSELRLQLALLPLATDNLQGNGRLRSEVCDQFDLSFRKALYAQPP